VSNERLTRTTDDRKRMGDAISGGIFMIGLGVLFFTGWWWPGILGAIGLSSGAGLIFRGRVWQGIFTMAFFFAIPIGIWIIQERDVDWTLVVAFILIGAGVVTLVKVLLFRQEDA
jgi:hypothetical protein